MNNTMTYKNYTARIDYDGEDMVIVGRVLGVRDIISFHGNTVHEVEREFHSAIDDYIADCAEQGIAPEKPVSGKLFIRISPDLHYAVSIAAQSSGKSVNQWVADVFKEAAK
jgi:predicted HicB family RNase H-like nuclease